MTVSVFEREYTAERNPEQKTRYPFFRSEEDTLQKEFYSRCIV